MNKIFTYIFLSCFLIFGITKNTYAKAFWELNLDNKYNNKEVVKFYPNPMISNATLKISNDINTDTENITVSFYNLVGSEVLKIDQIKNNDIKIDRDNFKSSGIYFYQLKIDDKIITTGRITVK